MHRAQPKKADGYTAAGPAVRAEVVDVLPSMVTVKIAVTDELLGAMMRGKVDHFIVAIAGKEIRAAIEPPVKAVK